MRKKLCHDVFSPLLYLVIVILFAVRKRYQKDSLASMKNSGEIHEQLVTYDEEGGGEMDTNGYHLPVIIQTRFVFYTGKSFL